MADEQEKKAKKPAIGSISQFATLGSKRRHQDVEPSEVQTFEGSTAQVTEPSSPKLLTPQTFDASTDQELDTQHLSESNLETSNPQTFDSSVSQITKPQTSRRSKVQTSKRLKIERVQQTAWIPPDTARWLRLRAVMEDREISEIITDALELYRQQNTP